MPLLKSKPKAEQVDTTSDWYDTPSEVTAANLERVNSASRKQKYRMWALIAALVCAPLALIIAVGGAGRTGSQASEISSLQSQISELKNRPTGGVQQVSDSPGRFAAQQAISSWLASTPSPLPGGKVLYWTGSKTMPTKSKADQRTLETFALVGGDGTGYSATYEVSIDPRGGAAVLAGPSLTAIPGDATDDWQTKATWQGVSPSSDVPNQVTGAVQSWANAYFSGNAQQLGLTVGDPNGRHTYEPMSGASKVSVTVTQYATTSNGPIAQVEMTPAWNDASDNNDGTGNSAPIVMDVLLKNANTAAPQVVAWGAPGTGPTLKPYENALTVPQAALAEPTSSATASPSSGPTQAPAKTETPSPKSTPTGKGKK